MANCPEIKRCDLQFGKKIGEGGYSTVYQMLWKSNGNKPVAVKKLNKVEKWELDILSKLNHSNIVHLLGVVDEEMDFMLVLEYCERGSLRSYLDEHRDEPLTSQMFYDWAEPAAKPIQYLKQMQIIHKDIKSPNYLIADNGGLKLADFGLAKKTDITISKATQSATAAWMAPELAKLGKLSPSYDIFALAVVLWELWTRQSPFKGKDHNHIIWIICEEDQRLTIPQDCPRILADLMRQCWETEWEKRPSIEQVLEVIRRARHFALSLEQDMKSVAQDLIDISICKDDDVSLDISPNTDGNSNTLTTYTGRTYISHQPSTMLVDQLQQTSQERSTNVTVKQEIERHQLQQTISQERSTNVMVKQEIERHLEVSCAERKMLSGEKVAHPVEEDVCDWRFDSLIGLPGPGQLSVPLGICVSPNDQCIAVVNMLPPKVNVYQSNGKYMFSLNAADGTPNPKYVAIGVSGNFFVSDGTQSVKVYGSTGTYLGKLIAVSPDNKASDEEDTELGSVAVNDDAGHILFVGEIKRKYISMHHSDDGQHISSIRSVVEPWNIAASLDIIAIGDCTTVLLVDYTGQVLRELNSVLFRDDTEEWLPRGLCCYGNKVMVCNYYSKWVCCISASTGDYIESIPTEAIVSRDVASTESGTKLYICALQYVQVYLLQGYEKLPKKKRKMIKKDIE